MKIYGYLDEGLPIEEIETKALAEITIFSSSDELSKVSDFFKFCASKMERMRSSYDHIHLSDKYKEFENSPHCVLMKNEN